MGHNHDHKHRHDHDHDDCRPDFDRDSFIDDRMDDDERHIEELLVPETFMNATYPALRELIHEAVKRQLDIRFGEKIERLASLSVETYLEDWMMRAENDELLDEYYEEFEDILTEDEDDEEECEECKNEEESK